MPEQYTKVEIIQPKWDAEKWASKTFQALFGIAVKTLILWWFFAAWFPGLGYTYWQLVLPVFAISILLGRGSWTPRQIK